MLPRCMQRLSKLGRSQAPVLACSVGHAHARRLPSIAKRISFQYLSLVCAWGGSIPAPRCGCDAGVRIWAAHAVVQGALRPGFPRICHAKIEVTGIGAAGIGAAGIGAAGIGAAGIELALNTAWGWDGVGSRDPHEAVFGWGGYGNRLGVSQRRVILSSSHRMDTGELAFAVRANKTVSPVMVKFARAHKPPVRSTSNGVS